MTLRTLNYGNYGIFLIMGSAGFCPSAVVSATGTLNYTNHNTKPAIPVEALLCNMQALRILLSNFPLNYNHILLSSSRQTMNHNLDVEAWIITLSYWRAS